MKLTSYFRSTAAYRVRIALNIKSVAHELVPINLFTGEHKTAAFTGHNPEGLLPTLNLGTAADDGIGVLTQSMAILEYLEESYPEPALLPVDKIERAYARGLANVIACDIHPLNNLRVLKYLVNDMGVSEENKLSWYHHWLAQGFNAIERRLANDSKMGHYCIGDSPTLADVCLVPQVYNAKRFEFALDDYPLIQAINDRCLGLPAFADARPECQPDAT